MTSTRLLAAAVGLAVILPALFLGGLPAVLVIVGVAMTISLAEYAAMAFPEDRHVAFAWMLLATLGLNAAAVWADEQRLAAVMALTVLGTMTQVVLRPGPDLALAAQKTGRFLLGIAWISLLGFLVKLREIGPDDGALGVEQGVWWVILALAVSWLSDTGAYFAGRRFGNRKLSPRVSPKKTWEGLFGGLATAVAGVFVMRWLFLPGLGVVDAVLLGAGGSLMSVVGDLCESLLKRAFDVKDSGWIMPGHGGLLDRIDSVLFVAPTVWSYMVLVHGA